MCEDSGGQRPWEQGGCGISEEVTLSPGGRRRHLVEVQSSLCYPDQPHVTTLCLYALNCKMGTDPSTADSSQDARHSAWCRRDVTWVQRFLLLKE